MAVAPARPLLAVARAELAADLGELAWIAGDQAGRARVADGGPMLAALRSEALADTSALEALARAAADGGSRRGLRIAGARRVEFAHALRRRQAILAGALVATSWQSPSIRHARCSQAGPANGRVTAHRDDYARDRHPAGAAYERALAATRSPSAAALLTSCGMSAVVVALARLERAGALREGVLLELVEQPGWQPCEYLASSTPPSAPARRRSELARPALLRCSRSPRRPMQDT